MKKLTHALQLIAVFILISCQSGSVETTNNAPQQDTLLNKEHAHEEDGHALTLNNGAKWKADSITNVNVKAIISTIDNKTLNSISDYHAMGDAVQQGINKLIEDCRMEGPDHDALHGWLEPLIEMNKQLKDSKTIEEAKSIFLKESQHIKVYLEYFE